MIHLLLLAIGLAAAAYQLLAIVAAILFLLRQRDQVSAASLPPVSILKPLRGLDEEFAAAIRSHAWQEYPAEFELLFGVRDRTDAAVPLVEQLQREFPQRQIRLIVTPQPAPNGKVGVLMGLAAEAKYPVLLVNDSDITVPRDYLQTVVAPLVRDPGVGLVTCLYRARAKSWAARWEALSIATEFAPGVLVAPLVGVREFALGSTLCFRAADLQRIGGFDSLRDYLADDYHLGRLLSDLGLRNFLSTLVVETRVGGSTWADVWAHQVRWARTIRVSKGGGYLGIPVTLTGVWIAVLALTGQWWMAAFLSLLRLAMAALVGGVVLRDLTVWWLLPLVPLRDCAALIVWAAGLKRGAVVWRDRVLHLTSDGRIRP